MAAQLITIWWRDIPMQVTARDRRQAHKVVLHPRFQVAVDQAAMQAGKKSASDYVEEMRREARPCGDDLVAEATAESGRIEAAYTRDVLARLVAAGGVDAEQPRREDRDGSDRGDHRGRSHRGATPGEDTERPAATDAAS